MTRSRKLAPRRTAEAAEAWCIRCGGNHDLLRCDLVDIYVVSDGEHLKIGKARIGKIQQRLGNLQVANARKLVLVGLLSGVSPSTEREIHYAAQSSRIRGEWFFDNEITWKALSKLRDQSLG